MTLDSVRIVDDRTAECNNPSALVQVKDSLNALFTTGSIGVPHMAEQHHTRRPYSGHGSPAT